VETGWSGSAPIATAEAARGGQRHLECRIITAQQCRSCQALGGSLLPLAMNPMEIWHAHRRGCSQICRLMVTVKCRDINEGLTLPVSEQADKSGEPRLRPTSARSDCPVPLAAGCLFSTCAEHVQQESGMRARASIRVTICTVNRTVLAEPGDLARPDMRARHRLLFAYVALSNVEGLPAKNFTQRYELFGCAKLVHKGRSEDTHRVLNHGDHDTARRTENCDAQHCTHFGRVGSRDRHNPLETKSDAATRVLLLSHTVRGFAAQVQHLGALHLFRVCRVSCSFIGFVWRRVHSSASERRTLKLCHHGAADRHCVYLPHPRVRGQLAIRSWPCKTSAPCML